MTETKTPVAHFPTCSAFLRPCPCSATGEWGAPWESLLWKIMKPFIFLLRIPWMSFSQNKQGCWWRRWLQTGLVAWRLPQLAMMLMWIPILERLTKGRRNRRRRSRRSFTRDPIAHFIWRPGSANLGLAASSIILQNERNPGLYYFFFFCFCYTNFSSSFVSWRDQILRVCLVIIGELYDLDSQAWPKKDWENAQVIKFCAFSQILRKFLDFFLLFFPFVVVLGVSTRIGGWMNMELQIYGWIWKEMS